MKFLLTKILIAISVVGISSSSFASLDTEYCSISNQAKDMYSLKPIILGPHALIDNIFNKSKLRGLVRGDNASLSEFWYFEKGLYSRPNSDCISMNSLSMLIEKYIDLGLITEEGRLSSSTSEDFLNATLEYKDSIRLDAKAFCEADSDLLYMTCKTQEILNK